MPVKKRVLVVHYSQSGQLSTIAHHFAQPLLDHPDIDVTFEQIKPVENFPFPWPILQFFDTFPEAVYLNPPAIQASTLTGEEDFDLIILAYQVWFLSPSLPTTAFLQSPVATKLLQDKPVVTLIACRNMWLMAQESVKSMLNEMGAKLIGNVALVDAAGSVGSFLATPVWVLSGNKGPHLGGLIPKAGVAPEAITACNRFGHRIVEKILLAAKLDETLLQGLGAVEVNEKLIASEKTAKRGFRIWGKLLRSLGPPGSLLRKPVILIYIVFLISFIILFIPLSVLIKSLLSPLTRRRTAQQKKYFSSPSGS
ncbi:MAG: dialkylresorcinol condensing enzyme [Gammaproteobacteria bacterium]|nr:dialkylresorcinol condensing enzyme [Gammaproteobacteria bacterium]